MGMGRLLVTLCVVGVIVIQGFVRTADAKACQDDKIKANPEACDSYLICLHGEELRVQCPAGLQFNKAQSICDWPANSQCNVVNTENNSTSTSDEDNEVGVDIVTTSTVPPLPVAHGPSPRFAPYIDVTMDGPKLSEIAEKTGQLDYTLAFALGSYAGCDPKWGAEKDLDDPAILSEIQKVQAKGGQMIVALGGAVGPYLEHLCTSADSLAEAYKKILDIVRTDHLDVDVEAPINLDLVTKALAKVQAERPLTTVSFTLMVQAEDYGLNPDLGLKTLEAARANGVKVHIVNPMTMEFGGKSSDWGDAVIGAAKAVLLQMRQIWPEVSDGQLRRMLGVTPMLGRNFNSKKFLPEHGRKLVDWANTNQIGFLSFWSIGRDNGNCANGPIKPTCSSVSQTDYEFTKIFQGFKG